MKTLKLMMIALTVIFLISSCKKDDSDPDPKEQFAGKWTGMYGFDSDSSSKYLCFQLKGNGILEEYNASNKKIGEGTWTFSENEFTTTYHTLLTGSNTYSFKAKFAGTNKMIEGTWGAGSSYINKGKFYLNK